MTATRRLSSSATGAALIAAVAFFPAGAGLAADRGFPSLPYELDRIAPSGTTDTADTADALPAVTTGTIDRDAQRCIAKVVHHEARNQPRAGMIAVAQTLINRLRAGGRFGSSICQVASQPGQFFDVRAYNPPEDSDGWQAAMGVARDALSGAAAVAPGALFFRAAYQPASGFFRGRQRVAMVGDQVFYR